MANEPTIEAMNLAIVEFMQVEKDHHSYLTGGRFRTVYLFDGYWLPLRKLKYHTSWDWLMPVGKKIRDLLNDLQKKRPPHTACHGDLIEVDIRCAVGEYDIVNAHKHMFTFITWYNEYQQQQNNDTTGTNKG